MQKNDLIRNGNKIIRILDMADGLILIVDCLRQSVPKWISKSEISEYTESSMEELSTITGIFPISLNTLDSESTRYTHARFTMIAGVLPFINDNTERCTQTEKMAVHFGISKQTINHLLWMYLVYQDISVLAPKKICYQRPLTKDEKNMRWALNKYFYNTKKNSLQTAYTMMLKDKYCDTNGVLLPEYPTIHQFRYFYRKHRKMQNYYISRDGLKNYQRNHRPLTGNGIQAFAPNVGIGMLDSTVCDIYLVDDSGNVVGRPILTACVDAYSGLCCGYSLSWEGGVYSLRNLMLNIITDKVELCRRHGIEIKPSEWDCSGYLPGVLVTDMGNEYVSENFGQVAELGVRIENLPAYRPELKGAVEKFFDLIQNEYKPYLKGKGVIEPDFQERGAHDYRRDACLTMAEFEKIILHCLIYYNSKRIIDSFPFTDSMLEKDIKPYASEIWRYGKSQIGANLVSTTEKQLILTLLPRTSGTFMRKGLIANKMRYHHDGYTEAYLNGGNVTVSYNPDDASCVWLIDGGAYVKFDLVESRFYGKSLSECTEMQTHKKEIVKSSEYDNAQAQITLAEQITTIAKNATNIGGNGIKGIRESRQKAQREQHINIGKKVQ